jgi:hypothetical protein
VKTPNCEETLYDAWRAKVTKPKRKAPDRTGCSQQALYDAIPLTNLALKAAEEGRSSLERDADAAEGEK